MAGRKRRFAGAYREKEERAAERYIGGGQAMFDVLMYLLLIGAAIYAFGAVWVVGEYIIKRINRRKRK